MPPKPPPLTSGESAAIQTHSGGESLQGGAVAEAVRRIIEAVAFELEVPFNEVMSRNRTQAVCYARYLAMFLAKELVPYKSSGDLAVYFERERSDLTYASRRVKNRMATDAVFRAHVDKIRVLVRPANPASPPIPSCEPSKR